MADTLESLEIEVRHSATGAADEINRVAEAIRNVSRALTRALPNMSAFNEALGGSAINVTNNNVTQVADNIANIRTVAVRASQATNEASRGIRNMSKAANNAHGPLSNFVSSLKRIAFYRFIRSVIKSITQAFSEGLQWAYQFSSGIATEGHRFAQALDNMKSATTQMKAQLGSAFIGLLAAIEPILIRIINLVTQVANFIAQLFAAFTGGTYLKATETSQKFADSMASGAKSAKEWKNQLMGFDVINRLNEPSGGGGGGGGSKIDPNSLFEDTPIAAGIQKFANAIKENLPLIEFAVGSSLLALGAILAFSGANVPLGLALMAAGALALTSAVKEDWTNLSPKVEYAVLDIATKVSMSLLALGALLAFSGINVPLGIGMMAAGVAGFGAVSLVWGKLSADVKEQLTAITVITSAALIALGAIMLFAGFMPLGIGLLIAGGAGLATMVTLNWNAITDKLKETWNNIKNWWKTNVEKYFTRDYWQEKIDNMFAIVAPHIPMPHFEVSWEPVGPIGSFFGLSAIPHIGVQFYAEGGFPEDGLFMANHGELVGKFANGRTAVANNEQIVEAVSRGVANAVAATLGSGDSRDIRVYLDGKEIGAASRRYERSMNRATGVSMA